jgi:hypothetical protein
VRVAQDPAADRQHHRPVPRYEGREGVLIVSRHERVEQLAIRHFLFSAHGFGSVCASRSGSNRPVSHGKNSPWVTGPCLLTTSQWGRDYSGFLENFL